MLTKYQNVTEFAGEGIKYAWGFVKIFNCLPVALRRKREKRTQGFGDGREHHVKGQSVNNNKTMFMCILQDLERS